MRNDPRQFRGLDTPAPRRRAFRRLAAVPPEVEWFANLLNRNTRKAYQADVRDFSALIGIRQPQLFQRITGTHVIGRRNPAPLSEGRRHGTAVANDTAPITGCPSANTSRDERHA